MTDMNTTDAPKPAAPREVPAAPVAEIDRDGVLWINTTPYRLPIGTKLYAGAAPTPAAPAPAVPADPTDPGFDVPVLREHVRHLERRVRQLAATPKEAPAPLTDAEIDVLWRAPMSADWEHREFARAIERAHGITAPTAPTGGEG